MWNLWEVQLYYGLTLGGSEVLWDPEAVPGNTTVADATKNRARKVNSRQLASPFGGDLEWISSMTA